jgi:uncharacterized protein
MLDDIFVIDGVAHCFDLSPSNFAHERYAAAVNGLLGAVIAAQGPGYDLDPKQIEKDWPVEDTANIRPC